MTSAEPAPTILNFQNLAAWAMAERDNYAVASPFPHAVNTSFLDPDVLAQIEREFPGPDDISDWKLRESLDDYGRPAQLLKLHCMNEFKLGATLRALLYELNSARFLLILEHLTGIRGLISDPHFQGAGLHSYLPGALLRVHSDFNFHPIYKLDRRLNLLLYLNDNWSPEWGGELEFWDKTMTRCGRRIAPISNTCVVFSTTKDSFHGMPDPLRCPEGRTRNSIALYYYSNGLSESERYEVAKTLWQSRPNERSDSAVSGTDALEP